MIQEIFSAGKWDIIDVMLEAYRDISLRISRSTGEGSLLVIFLITS